MSEKNNLFTIVTSVLGLIAAIGTVSSLILRVIDQPELLHIFSIVTYIVVGMIVFLVILNLYSNSQFWHWVILGAFYVITIPFFLWVGSWSTTNPKQPPFPVPWKVYDFEEGKQDWEIEGKSVDAQISPDCHRSGAHALKLLVDLQPSTTNKCEIAGIQLANLNHLEVKAITAWVFIPPSEPVQNIGFGTGINAYINDSNDSTPGFLGKGEKIEPGIWTPVYIGTFGQTDKLPNEIVWNGEVDNIHIAIWSDKPYNGSICIDDISIYE